MKRNPRPRMMSSRDGLTYLAEPEVDTSGMLSPVRCNHCHRIYDLCGGEVVARYADCTVYKTPCCGRTVDDRPSGWTATPAFTRLSAS